MNDYNWKDAFPEPTQEFHKRVCVTLNNLEKERFKMKKTKFIAIAAAAVMVIGAAAFASSGAIRVISGGSSAFPTYTSIPSSDQLEKKIGITPKIVQGFSNGYVFESAFEVKNRIEDIVEGKGAIAVIGEDGKKQQFKSLSVRYVSGDNKITVDSSPDEFDIEKKPEEAEIYNGVSIGYTAYTNKFVPGDYQQTEQDIKDEAEGKYVFSYGTDDIEIHEIQGVTWTQDGIKYHINAMDSPLGERELINMAKELIDF